jgi:hypothetical protein
VSVQDTMSLQDTRRVLETKRERLSLFSQEETRASRVFIYWYIF